MTIKQAAFLCAASAFELLVIIEVEIVALQLISNEQNHNQVKAIRYLCRLSLEP